jgi:hypothetical protein
LASLHILQVKLAGTTAETNLFRWDIEGLKLLSHWRAYEFDS